MKKGITTYFGYHFPIEERMKLIKEAGFDYVMMDASDKFIFQNGTLKNQVRIAKEKGLGLSSLHASYSPESLTAFWKEGEEGEGAKEKLIEELKLCKKYGFRCLVFHMRGKTTSIGLKRIEEALTIARQLKIPLAMENLNEPWLVEEMLETFDDEYFKICFDMGHWNLFPPTKNYFKEYANRIGTFHLHSNDGWHDLHTLRELAKIEDIGYHDPIQKPYGSRRAFIDWEEVAKQIAQNNIDLPLDYELNNFVDITKNYQPGQMLKLCYDEACKLEQDIMKHKKPQH
jgi:sugar phosphate isomerase/epimerase